VSSPGNEAPIFHAGDGKSAFDELIREADGRDAEVVAELWTQAYVTEGLGGRCEPYTAIEFTATLARGTVLVAERQGSVLGVVALLPPSAKGRAVARDGEAELARLAVASPSRRAGVGRALVLRCEELARAEDWPAIALWSRAYQTAAHRLYESLGYRRVPERDTTDETGHKRLVFRLDLGALAE
jgi:ribosomal protein S18 acetylase RimI-like enzyme